MNTPDWHADAACKGHPTKWWFPDVGQTADRAIAICNECPVIDHCRREHHDEAFGVWAGVHRQRGRTYVSRRETPTELERIYDALAVTPNTWLTYRAVAARAGLQPQRANTYLRRLRDRGIVEHDREGNVWRVAPEVT